MAIDVFFYCENKSLELSRMVAKIRQEHSDIFAHAFLFSSARELNVVEKEVAVEAGFLIGNSIVLLHLDDKSFAHRLSEMSGIVKSYFKVGSILALVDGERKI